MSVHGDPGSSMADGAGSARVLSAAWLRALRDGVVAGRVPDVEGGLVELLTGIEDTISALAAVRASALIGLDRAVRRREAAAGVAVDARGAGVVRQVGLAVRVSPTRAQTLLGAARAWVHEMPHTFAALQQGWLNEHRALLVVRETGCLPVVHRREADRRLCADPQDLAGMGTKRLVARAKAVALELDPACVAERFRRAAGSAWVSVRPLPDGMAQLRVTAPLAQAVAAYAAIKNTVDTRWCAQLDSQGRPVARGMQMADLAVERLTGQAAAANVPVTVNLVISDRTLLGAGHEPATLLDDHGQGYGPVPAQIARSLIAAGIDAGAAWLRKIYTTGTGELVAMTSLQRFFPSGLATALTIRDQGICRTPYCDAPIRQLDHVVPSANGGRTTYQNGQGLCQACNLAKEAVGWRSRSGDDPDTGRHRVTTTSPSGQVYTSIAPAPPLPATRGRPVSVVERCFDIERYFDIEWNSAAA